MKLEIIGSRLEVFGLLFFVSSKILILCDNHLLKQIFSIMPVPDKNEKMKVSPEDSHKKTQIIDNEKEAALFQELMTRPAQINKKLSASAARYRELVGE